MPIIQQKQSRAQDKATHIKSDRYRKSLPISYLQKPHNTYLHWLPACAYIITEIATDDGYTLLKDAITVVITSAENGIVCDVCGKSGITATATVNGDAVGMIEDNGSLSAIVPMSVVNTRGFDLPQTGENGTWMFAVGGVLIVSLSAAVIFFILAKKRKADEQ